MPGIADYEILFPVVWSKKKPTGMALSGLFWISPVPEAARLPQTVISSRR